MQSGEIQKTPNFWIKQLSSSSNDAWTSEQCDEYLAANSHAAYKFLEDLEISMSNHDLMQL